MTVFEWLLQSNFHCLIGTFRYTQQGYGYSNQYYNMPPYQQGTGYPYGNGQMGPLGQAPPLPQGPPPPHSSLQGK